LCLDLERIYVWIVREINTVMPGLVPGIHAVLNHLMQGGFVYIVTNKCNGILYVGVTSDLLRRAYEHREGVIKGFTQHYGLKRLVYYEHHDDIRNAIQREKTIKHWPRAWKVSMGSIPTGTTCMTRLREGVDGNRTRACPSSTDKKAQVG
jgi:putative endonuclease